MVDAGRLDKADGRLDKADGLLSKFENLANPTRLPKARNYRRRHNFNC
jgi:hypothetical protein